MRTVKIPEGEEYHLFLDDVIERILTRYMHARAANGHPVCTDVQIIRGIMDITMHRLIFEQSLDVEEAERMAFKRGFEAGLKEKHP